VCIFVLSLIVLRLTTCDSVIRDFWFVALWVRASWLQDSVTCDAVNVTCDWCLVTCRLTRGVSV